MSVIDSINDLAMKTLWSVLDYDLSVLEFVAVVSSIVGVWLGTTAKRWTWPWWALSSALYGWLFFNWNLYASALLQIVFILAGIWGWLGWGPKGATPRSGTHKQVLMTILGGLVAWVIIAPLLAKVGAAATWPDSFGLVFSVIAQIIMVLEYRESWTLWFIVDAVYSIEYFTQHLWFTSILYVLFTAIALRGWMNWGRMKITLDAVRAEAVL